ncbi:HET domain containing protein [Hyaloscypha variabilis]
MWLLNVKTMKLEGFMADIPRYSILSHCWGHEEVTFQDLNSGHFQHLKGYQKIAGCCKLSQREGFAYTWIDTCCIDKSSSAELTEAINSMFTWYKDSSVCYTYMEDVGNENPRDPGCLFFKSKWFTRGWTLQELIAPDIVVFFSSTWMELGTRGDLAKTISTITGIDRDLLLPSWRTSDIATLLRCYTVACKMSWAAKRQTTRVEDVAYCLMGLFDVNMPLLYGEGKKSFIRLQKEIINSSNDFSIFAWYQSSSHGWLTRPERRGILAPAPSAFKTCLDIRGMVHDISSQSTFEVYKSDIRMQVPTIEMGSPKEHLNLLVRQEITPEQFAPPEDVRTFLKGVTGRYGVNHEAFIAIIPRGMSAEFIGLAFLEPGQGPLERLGLVYFQEFFEPPQKLSTFQVPITHDLVENQIYSTGGGRATVRLAPNCLLSPSESTVGLLRNPGRVYKFTLFVKIGNILSLSIKVIDRHQPCPEFVVVLEYRDDRTWLRTWLGNCMAVRDGDTIEKATEEARKKLQSSNDTSEIRAPLVERYEAVVKFRISPTECEILVGVEEVGVD